MVGRSPKQIIISDSATESLAEASLQHTHLVEHRELLNSYQWIEAGASIDEGVAERYAERIKSRKEDKEEHSSEDNADQAGIVARRPRTIKSVLEKAKLLPLTATNRDGQWAQGFVAHLRLIKTEVGSRSMVGLQKLLAFAFSVIGARALATSAAFARESAGIIGLYKDIVATEGPGEAHHYSSLASSLVCPTKQKFENVFSEVSLLVRCVNTAHFYSEFENELQDKKSSEYQKYKAAVEGHKKEFGKPHMGASRRQYILTQAGPWRVWRARRGPSSWAVRGQAVGQEPLYQDGEAAQHRPSRSRTSAMHSVRAFDDNMPQILNKLVDSHHCLVRVAERRTTKAL
ncbi:hypothetical protein D6D13_08321 [Aureobasidium pullulans]|uniref:Uncharacterized protein n=1 Tax=Aureobasidium pullulans TaxID=5580 RepID=A0A4S9C782_AURPU|nr:hypothetical protein D6D13_08321 [Aureobasidium pullulans]